MTQNENATREISCHRTKIIVPKNTDNIKLSIIVAEHQNLKLGPPEYSHIYHEDQMSITNQSYPDNNLSNVHQWINSQQIDQYFGCLSLLFVAILLMMTSSRFVERINLGTLYDCTRFPNLKLTCDYENIFAEKRNSKKGNYSTYYRTKVSSTYSQFHCNIN